MNKEKLDKEIRQFLKKVGIQSNQAMEAAIREAVDQGRLNGDERLNAVMHLTMADLAVEV